MALTEQAAAWISTLDLRTFAVLLLIFYIILQLSKSSSKTSTENHGGASVDDEGLANLGLGAMPPGKKLEIALDPPVGLHWSNPEEPFPFETELCKGSYFFFHPPTDGRAFRGASGGLDFAEYFRGKTRLWELRIQFVCKKPLPCKDLYFGVELEDYVHLPAAAKRVVQLSVAAIRQAVGGVYNTQGDDPAKAIPGEESEKPTIVLPLWAFDQFIITQPGEEVPDMTSPDFPEYGSRRKGRIAEYIREMDDLAANLGPGPTYTLGFWGNSRFLDVMSWKLRGIPLVTPFDFEPLIGQPPVYAVLYCLTPAEAGRDGKAESRHLNSRKKYMFRAAIWNSEKRVTQELFERLTGLRSSDRFLPESTERKRSKGGLVKNIFSAMKDPFKCCSGPPGVKCE
ncbi:Uncharacterized protein SCF082_LOCUS17459 [Durusdinium trenchii]|uniref:Domain of unknown function at the cortex 1 domain-containing protein n=1 Tax=Durusdinium trenchii TaxID=1381693 RepID=A0ABP0KI74_9DINO